MTSLISTSTILWCSINWLVCSPRTHDLVYWIPRSLTIKTDSTKRIEWLKYCSSLTKCEIKTYGHWSSYFFRKMKKNRCSLLTPWSNKAVALYLVHWTDSRLRGLGLQPCWVTVLYLSSLISINGWQCIVKEVCWNARGG